MRHIAQTRRDRAGQCGEQTLLLDGRLRGRRAGSTAIPRPAMMAGTVPSGKRLIHDAGNQELLPGTAVRDDDDPPTGDPAVDEAHLSAGQAWDLFADTFGRRSYDGNGATALVTVHFGRDYDNAFWDGQQLVFGDGDGELFDRFTKPMDVMVHEFTHAVVQYTAALAYADQPGALNESVADVFAALARQQLLNHTAEQADWLIGVGLFLPGVQARALRSMLEPGTAYDDPRIGKDPQVGSMADYVHTEDDNGGVHINSGIPNRAFALAARALGGHAWERAGQVWYRALSGGSVGPRTDFEGFAAATVAAAMAQFPDQPDVAEQVRSAWREVGLEAASPSGGQRPAPVTPPVTPPGKEPGPERGPEPGPGSEPEPAERVAVRRTGGFAGSVRRGELDLEHDPQGPEVRELLRRVNFAALTMSAPAPDRFIYTVEYREQQVTLPEQDLTPELSQVVRIVLGRSGGGLG